MAREWLYVEVVADDQVDNFSNPQSLIHVHPRRTCNAIGGRLVVGRYGSASPFALLPLGPIDSDSRKIEPGDVFWAFAGPNHEGENSSPRLFAAARLGAVVAKDVALPDLSLGDPRRRHASGP